MRDNFTDISIVLDRSGSMASVRNDTIGGFNTFLAEQKEGIGEVNVSLVQFDTEYETLYTAKRAVTAPQLSRTTYKPRGSTALLDAIGRMMNETGERLAAMPEAQRPSRVLFVIVTDGEENSSRVYSWPQIGEKIAHQKSIYNWEFLFIGANQDAIRTGQRMNIAESHSITYHHSGVGVTEVFKSVSQIVSKVRRGEKADMVFEESDRIIQRELMEERVVRKP